MKCFKYSHPTAKRSGTFGRAILGATILLAIGTTLHALTPAINPKLVQTASLDAGTTTTGSLAFTSSNTTGDWIAVAVRGGMSSSQIFTVTDSNGNAYKKAGQVGFTSSAVTLAIYYAENIKGGANTVTVSDTVSGPLRVAILEYSGVATSSSLDKVAVATGTSALPNSGSLNTTASGDLLLGAIATTNTAAVTAGSGYGIKNLVPPEPSTKLMTEDQVQAAAGVASASATLGGSDTWGAVLAAFKTATGGGVTGPQITSINPTAGLVGTSVTITGANFGASQGTSTVTFNGTAAIPTSWSATSTVTPVPSGATTGNVVVTVGSVASNGVAFTVTTLPSITSLSPTSGALGTSVAIAGANFGSTQGTSTVTFNGTASTPTSWSATSIVTPVPSGATTGNVVVTVGGLASNGVAFTVASAPGLISLMQHKSIDAGITTSFSLGFVSANTAGNWIAVVVRAGLSSAQVFTVKDSNGNTYKKAAQVGFTASAVTLAIYYAENVKGGANTLTVSDTVSGPFRFAILEYSGIATSNSLDVTAAATGTSTSPNSGNLTTTASGDLLLGAIATTNAAVFTAASGYTIADSVPAEPNTKVVTEDQIQAASGAASTSATLAGPDIWGAVSGAFKAATGGGGPRPQIMSLNPTSAPVGTSVTITGGNFGASQGTSTVTFNGITATPTSWSVTSIVPRVPSGASTGSVMVTVGGLASNGVAFAVTIVPSVTIQPTSQNVIAGNSTTFLVIAAGTAPLSYQWQKNGASISGATSSTYTTPAETTGDNGAQFTVAVSNSAGSVTSNAAALTVNAAPPGLLTTSTSSLNFGNVNIGSGGTLGVTFSTSGSSNITISNVTISGAGFSVNGISTGLILSPGASVTMNVIFAPAASGSVTGSVTITSNASNTPLTIVFSGTGVVATHLATLTWNASTSTVNGYNLYRGTVSGGPYTKINSSVDANTTFTDTTVQAGQTYYWVVTAVDSSNVESSNSNEVSATVPTP